MKWVITGSRGISDIEYIGNILSDILKRFVAPELDMLLEMA